MKKRIISTVLAAATATSMLAGYESSVKGAAAATGKQEQSGDATAEKDKTEGADPADVDASGKKLEMVYLCSGSLGDKGFNDPAASDMQMLADQMGAEVKIIEMGRGETSYESNCLDASEQDWDMIVSDTWFVREPAQDTASQFLEKNYLILDISADRNVITDDSVMEVNCHPNQAAFLSGVLTTKMLDSGDVKVDASGKTLGFVGFMDISNTNDFLVGYPEGIQYVDPEIRVVTFYVGSFKGVSKYMEMTTQLCSQGAQVIYAPASQPALGVVAAAQKSDKYLTACDQDLYSELKKSDPQLAVNIILSSLKNVGESTYTSIRAWSEGTVTLDQDCILGLDGGAIGLAENGNCKAIVPEEIQRSIDGTEQKIISGDIAVGIALDMSAEDVAALRDGTKP